MNFSDIEKNVSENNAASILVLLGRIAIAWLYIEASWSNIFDIPQFIQTQLVPRGVPAADLLGYIAIIVETVGSLALLFGIGNRWAAVSLIAFTMCTMFIAHRFWEFPTATRFLQKSIFYKEAAIIGGLLFLVVTGPGRISIERLP
jgi:putative oxidoreductase